MSVENCPGQAREPVNVTNVKPYGIVYCATNKVNKKRYVGQTVGYLSGRKQSHREHAKYRQYPFGNAINKYGLDGFDWKVIDSAHSREELDVKEIFWIKQLETLHPWGYNLREGGRQCRLNPESRKKLSVSHKEGRISGRILPPPNRGKAMSEEQKRQLRKPPRKTRGGIKKGRRVSIISEFPAIKIRCVETGEIFESLSAAARRHDIGHSSLSAYLSGKRKSAAGHQWEKVINSSVSQPLV